MIEPIAPPRRKDPLARTRRPALPPGGRSRRAKGLTRAAAEGRFELQRCAECAAFAYPPRDACPVCLSDRLPFEEAPRTGTLLSETMVRVPSDVYFRERAPWRIGLVALDCGPTAIAHLHADCREGEPVLMSLQLDKSGQAVMFAMPSAETPNMSDDRQWREMSADPTFRRILIADGRTPVGLALAAALSQAGAGRIFVGLAEPWKPFPGEAALRAIERVEIVPLDVTDERSVDDLAADLGGKTDILINNIEHVRPGGLLDRKGSGLAREEIDAAYLGLVRLAQAFGPAMRSRGADGVNSAAAWVNILSCYALVNWPAYGAYSASQAACLSVSQCLRSELRPGGVRVINVFSGPTETEWFQTVPPPKVAPQAIARATVAALQKGREDVYVGDVAEDVRARFADNPKAIERELSE